MEEYYFVFYKCEITAWRPKAQGGGSTGIYTNDCQAIINVHPLQFQIDSNEKYGKEREDIAGYTKSEQYTVINWIKLTKEEYEKYKDQVG